MDWLQWLTSGGVVAALVMALSTWLRTRPKMKEVELQGEAALWEQIAELKAELKKERETCDERIDRIEERHSLQVAALNAEVQIGRHDRGNVRQALNAMFAMIKQIDHPELPKIVATVEEMLARGDEVISKEKAALPALKAGRIP